MTFRSSYLADRPVNGSGPFDAPLLWVGEAPGREEVLKSTPFVGASGQWVRSELRFGGLDVDRQVRFDNVVPVNPGKLLPSRYTSLLDAHWDHLSESLCRMQPRVVVACGGLALRRLTGLTDITDEHAGVIPVRDLPENVMVRGQARPHGLPKTAYVVPLLHPAGIMRTKLQADRVTWRIGCRRAVALAMAEDGLGFKHTLPTCEINPAMAALEYALFKADAVSIDTEFDRVTKIPYLIGLYTGTGPVWILKAPFDRWLATLRFFLQDAHRLLKISHNNSAEWQSLATLGLDTRGGRWYDTMLAYATLYPDVNVGLEHASLHYVDGARNWKWLDSTDPAYLTRDVYYQWCVYTGTHEELYANGMLQLFTDEVMAVAGVLYDLERGGLKVDRVAQDEMLAANERARVALAGEIEQAVGAYFGVRVESQAAEVHEAEVRLSYALAAPIERVGHCERHPTYDGRRKKRFMPDVSCECQDVYESPEATSWRAAKDAMRKTRNKAVGAHEKLTTRGFKPGNNNDLRWLLYDRAALALPVQTNDEGRPTANADAVQRLAVGMLEAHDGNKTKSKYYRPDAPVVVALLTSIKEYQHLEKLESTFLKPPVDAEGVAHAPYRGWGTGTGRPAGGADDDADDSGSEYAFNMLNVPKECRRIFVPHVEGNVFVAADYSQMESWATAWFADDEVMLGELRDQLTGGPKVHALNAALIYGIEHEAARTVVVSLKGRKVKAYEGGKRTSHMVNYGAEGGMLARTFWLPRKFADGVARKLHVKYERTTVHRTELADEVFGSAMWVCSRCNATADGSVAPACRQCSRPKSPVMLRFAGWGSAPTRVHYTPFRRRRWYLGRRRDGSNALASQDPQSACASVAYRTLCRLAGYEVVDGRVESWPTPSFDYWLRTFTYDANVLECAAGDANELLTWLLWTMEQPWRELGGLRFPAEGSIGRNWMDASAGNPDGLVEQPVTPLSSVWAAVRVVS